MSDIRFEGWLHKTGTGGVYQDAAGNVGIASTQPKTRLDIGNGGFQVGPAGICTVTTVNTTNLVNATPLSHRNLIINGAMRIAQRATSSTENGYGDLDRWKHEYAGTDENPTFAQTDVSGTETDSPLLKGITKTSKITNGNQTSGLQASSLINFNQQIEAQDIRNSGWIYSSPTSFITLSYYVKASVTQEYHGFVKTVDGTNYVYPFSLGTITANTWTKITKTIPGNSNLQIDDNTDSGFQVFPVFFGGTNYTASSVTNNAWATWSSGERSTDQTATWFTTNDSTIEITGVQLELGSVATPFEHRSIGDELARCQRYYYRHATGNSFGISENATQYNSSSVFLSIPLPTEMRAAPTLEITNSSNHFLKYANNGPVLFDTLSRDGVTTPRLLCVYGTASGTSGHACMIRTNSSDAYIAAVAEI